MAQAKYPARDGYKVCNVCLKELPLSEFYLIQQRKFRYYDSKCSSCKRIAARGWYANNKERSYAYHRKWNAKNRERSDFLMWRSHVRRKYGLSNEQAAELFSDPKCGICGLRDSGNKHSKKLYVDHCHKTKKVRGLLCDQCNRAVARIDKIPDWCEKATAYLNALSPAIT